MSYQPYLGQIHAFSFGFPPKGWALCNGQLLPIAQNQALFSLLGTTYGGNGQTNFALPDLRGRSPIHTGTTALGAKVGQESVTLTAEQTAPHTVYVSGQNALSNNPAGRLPAQSQFGPSPGASANQRYSPGECRRWHVVYRQWSSTPEYAAVPCPQLLYCPTGCLSKSDLSVREDPCHSLTWVKSACSLAPLPR
jgi:microcystin-dependent protein